MPAIGVGGRLLRSRPLRQRIECPTNCVDGLSGSVLVDVVRGAADDSDGAIGCEFGESVLLSSPLGFDSRTPGLLGGVDTGVVAEDLEGDVGPRRDLIRLIGA